MGKTISIEKKHLIQLREAGKVESVSAMHVQGGWLLSLNVDDSVEYLLVSQRGDQRLFKTLDAAARFSLDCGFCELVVELGL